MAHLTENQVFNLVSGSAATGQSTYDMWKSIEGNEDKSVQDFLNYLKDDGEGGSVSEETLAQIEQNKNDISQLSEMITYLKENGVSGTVSTVKMSISKYVGQLFDKSNFDGKPYIGWALGNTQYDKADDTINVLINAADYHGDGSVTDLYLMKMNPSTLDYELTPIVKGGEVVNQSNTDVSFDDGSKGAYTYGFCIDSNGDYLFMPNYCNDVYLFRSSDKGNSWKVTVCTMPERNDTAFTGLMQTSTGRLIVSTHSAYFWYSDDNGANWTKCSSPTSHSVGHEAEIVELKENTLIAVMRRKWSDTTTGDWQGNYVKAPAVISYSYDNGTTWTNPVESKTITEMCSTGCAIAKLSDDRLELYATSRYPHGDAKGVIYKHSASIDEALEDNWSSGKVIRYAKAVKGDDFGYPSCCVDSVGNTHIFYYDGDSIESGSTNYYYIQSYQDINNVPINADDYAFTSPCIPYSAQKVIELITASHDKLQAQINKLVIQGGGTPETDGSLDGKDIIYDGLIEYFDFTDSDAYDSTNGVYTSVYGHNVKLYASEWNAPETELDFVGYIPHWGVCSDTGVDESTINAFTLEAFIEYQNGGNTYTIFSIGSNNNSSNNIKITGLGVYVLKYRNVNDGISDNTEFSGDKCSVHGAKKEHHLVFTVSETEWAYYVDGELAKSIAVPSDFSGFASGYLDKYIFGDQSRARKFRVYNRALSAEEVKNNYLYETK